MFDLIKKAAGVATSFAKANPVMAGLGIAALVLPKLFGGATTSPAAMMGAQGSIGAQIPPGGIAPPGVPPMRY